jgi:hypothetical protein
MRYAVLAGFLGLVAVMPAVSAMPALTVRAATATTGPQLAAGPRAKIIEYGGVRLSVPAGWPVYRLDQEPTRCVRYDRHAVYLGRAGTEQDCPARMAGRTETLQLEPLGRSAGSPAAGSRSLPEASVTQEIKTALPAAGVLMTGTYGSDRALLEGVMRDVRIRPGAQRALSSLRMANPVGPGAGLRTAARHRPVRQPRRLGQPVREWATGAGFDACTAPSLAAMAAWRHAYRVANIYIGGAARGCAQPNLTWGWMRAVRRKGYRLIPTYVGLQAPCSTRQNRFTAKNAYRRGRTSADDAIRRAAALGIPSGNPIYFDMEAYDNHDGRCLRAVLTFIHSWSRRLRHRGYVPGMYSSVGSGIRDLGQATGITKPEAIWFARWDGKARTDNSRYLEPSWWSPHRRIKQYRGGHHEKHGGIKLNVDSNVVDGPVY